jgi:hypothetical protein
VQHNRTKALTEACCKTFCPCLVTNLQISDCNEKITIVLQSNLKTHLRTVPLVSDTVTCKDPLPFLVELVLNREQ